PPVQDWSGVYVGVEAGYGWGNQRFNQAFDPFFLSNPVLAPLPSLRAPVDLAGPDLVVHDPTISSVNQRGWLGGGFGGVQKQWGSLVLGLEAGIDGADIKGSTTATNSQTCVSCRIVLPVSEPAALLVIDRPNIKIDESQTINSKIDLLGFAGPKIGWAFSPSWMIYGTGGLAWAHLEANASQNQTVQRCDTTGTNCIPFTFDSSFDFSRTQSGGLTMFGWAAGAGLTTNTRSIPAQPWCWASNICTTVSATTRSHSPTTSGPAPALLSTPNTRRRYHHRSHQLSVLHPLSWQIGREQQALCVDRALLSY